MATWVLLTSYHSDTDSSASPLKDPDDYTGPMQIIWDNFPVFGSADEQL